MQDNFHRPDDHEAKMARADLFKCAQYSFKLFKMISEDQELEGWVQAKITKAADYIASVYHYMEYEMKISEYGSAIENSDMYSESIRRAFAQKLTEAKVEAKKAKAKMASKEKDLEEAFDDKAKVGDKKKTATGELTKTDTGVVHRNTSYADDGEADDKSGKGKKSHAKSQSAAEKKSQAPKLKQSPKSAKTWGMKDSEKFDNRDKSVAEGAKPDFLDMDKDGNKKEPMKKAVADKKAGPKKGVNPFAKVKEQAISGAPQKSGIPATATTTVPGMRATQQDLKKAGASAALGEGKCNHTPKGKSCPVHGLKECGGMYEETHQAKTTMKHVNASDASPKVKAAIGKAAKDIKPGVKGYKDRADALTAAGIKR
jgi:hypothetical protein